MEPMQILVYVGAALAGLLVGGLWGRLGGGAAARTRELQAEVDALVEQGERHQAERAQLEAELDEARSQSAAYKQSVVEHFYGTSEQLRGLTLQYRSVFEHLADGARALCPESFPALEGRLQPPVLDPGEAPTLETDPEDVSDEPVQAEEIAR